MITIGLLMNSMTKITFPSTTFNSVDSKKIMKKTCQINEQIELSMNSLIKENTESELEVLPDGGNVLPFS